ncbi:coiled-coil domain-containing protein 63-like [Lycorma delicatula]|uniref:coiled-coil domain-containing protein 63-like n=1 Tax=Lycorma delicatula TaxID=130591 RepID=UPI003F510AE9
MAIVYHKQLDEEDFKKLAEDEYFRLEGKFRTNESKKVHFPTRLKAILIQQERIIDILEKQQEDLKNNIAVTNSKCYRGVEEKRLTSVYNSIEYEKVLDNEIAREIEDLLIERKNFFKSYTRLYNQLLSGKQIMMDLVEQATMTYNQREEAQTRLTNLKEKTKAEKRIQSKDVQDLKRKLENVEELQQFLSIKGQRHEKDIDKFVARFKKSEEENLSLFNYCNEVNDEVEVLQSQVFLLLESIDEQRELNQMRANEQQSLINNLQNKLTSIEYDYAEAINELERSKVLLTDLLFSIEKMFLEFECNDQPILALLGNNAHVNVFNVSLCLRLLELQLYEFIYLAYAKERHAPPQCLLEGQIVQDDYHIIASKRPILFHLTKSTPCPLCVETDRIFILDENNETDVIEEYDDVHQQIKEQLEEPEELVALLHNISTCRLPRSRAIMQARFQEQEHEKMEAPIIK